MNSYAIKGIILRILSLLAKIFAGLLFILFVFVLFIRSPWGQNIIKDKAISYLAKKTQTTVSLDRLYLTFTGNITVEGLYIEDQLGDTILLSNSLIADIPFWPILKGEGITLNKLDWDDVRIKIHRRDSLQGFNYEFLIAAFSSRDTALAPPSDTSSKEMRLSVGEINLSRIKADYRDDFTGMAVELDLGTLNIHLKETDLNQMHFEIGQVRLENTKFEYELSKPFPESEDATPTVLPFIGLDKLEILNLRGHYRSKPDGIAGDLDIKELNLQAPVIDLSNNHIQVDYFGISHSSIQLDVVDSGNPDPATEVETKGGPIDFSWPEWDIAIGKIHLEENKIAYLINGKQPEMGNFNSDAISVDHLHLDGNNLFIDRKSAGATLNNLSFHERSGLEVDKLQFQVDLDDQQLLVNSLEISAMGNHFSGRLHAGFDNITALLESPEKSILDLNFSKIIIRPELLFLIQPDLRENEYLRILQKKAFTGNLIANGPVSFLRIREMGIQWGHKTAAFASGRIFHPTDPDRFRFDFPNVIIKTTRNDILYFTTEEELGVRLPEDIRLTALVRGHADDITTDAFLQTSLGQIRLEGRYQNTEMLTFAINLVAERLQLDSLLQNEQYGPLTLTLDASGAGDDLNMLDVSFKSNIESFEFNGYPIQDWAINGKIIDGSGQITSSYQDENLNVELDAYVELDSISPSMDATLRIDGADLAALGMMNKSVKISFEAKTRIKGNVEELIASLTIDDGTVVVEEKSYPLGTLHAALFLSPDSTTATIQSKMLNLALQSNTSPAEFSNAMIHHIESYLSDSIRTMDSLQPYARLHLEASLAEIPVISEVFLPQLTKMDTLRLLIDFQEEEKNLTAKLDIPFLDYGGYQIDSVAFSANSDKEQMDINMGLKRMDAGFLTINKTLFTNEIKDQKIYSQFEAQYKDKDLIHIKTIASQLKDTIEIHLDPSDLVFDGKDWDIPENNGIWISQKKLLFRNFRIQSGAQRLAIDDNPGHKDLNIDFQNFKIENLISYFNPDTLLASGFLNGNVTVQEPLGDAGLFVDLKLNNLRVKEIDMGNLSLNGRTEDAKDYTIKLDLEGGAVDLSAEIDYKTDKINSNLDLSMAIDRIDLTAIESFSMGSIKNSSGYLSGHVDAEGPLEHLKYNGRLRFNESSVTVSELNTPFEFGNQELTFENQGINLNNFTISDENGNSFTLNGSILTSDLVNPSFDLTMQANDFQILNASKEDNDLFYGKASFDAKATLKGDLNLPVLKLQLQVGPSTDITYIMPQGEAALNKRDGIVEFVNKAEPEDTLTKQEEESVVLKGYDIQAVVSIDKEALFKVIISEETGDHFQIAGDGDLNFNIDPGGRISLSGIYHLEDGHYEMNLYNLVTRRFDIAQGSTISWSGDPFDAKLDVRAIYKIETSASSLMASQTSGANASVQKQYQRKLPFWVYLNVDGQLSAPTLGFNLDMPEEAQGLLGGQVFGRIQQINEEDQELNKQVFSLLVLGRFYPSSGSDGSSGGIANVARENLNQALSDQLNMFSDKLLGETGLELNFGLESYTDYQGPSAQNRTELDIAAQKKFLDDRLIVKVGSEVDIEGSNANPNESNPLIGNVSVEYLLTEQGNFRIKGFRKNVYENVIDGQTIVSGLALIFTKEFNKFNELWKSLIIESHNGSSSSKSQ